MPYKYQETHRYVAQVAGSIEEAAAEELAELGAADISTGYRVIYFGADPATLYRANYLSQLVSRVLAPLEDFSCHSTRYLYGKAKSIAWRDFFRPKHTFAVSANVSNSKISHSHYAALCVKDAVADYFREDCGSRPNVDKLNPDVRIHLHIGNNRATISLDTSGESLHRRKYRQETVEAPMQETVAAAIIRLTEWDGSRPLHDPMCGSGTLVSEALMWFCRIPPGILRHRFGFQLMPEFDPDLWEQVKRTADSRVRPLPEGLVSGSDVSRKVVAAAEKNISGLPGGNTVRFTTMGFEKLPGLEDQVIVCNPPYGIRLMKGKDIDHFHKTFGDFLKQRCRGSTAFIYFGNREMIKRIGLKPSWKKPLMSGGLDGRLVKYELY